MLVTRHRLKLELLYHGDAYALGPVFWLVWRWQVAERFGSAGGLALGRRFAKRAARAALQAYQERQRLESSPEALTAPPPRRRVSGQEAIAALMRLCMSLTAIRRPQTRR